MTQNKFDVFTQHKFTSIRDAAVILNEAGFRCVASNAKKAITYHSETKAPLQTPIEMFDDTAFRWDPLGNRNVVHKNVAVLTGGDFFVVDVDGPIGIGNMTRLEKWFPSSPIMRINTPRGYHMYYACDTWIPTCVGLLDGIDIRGDEGMVLVPPSYHYKHGVTYGSFSIPREMIEFIVKHGEHKVWQGEGASS